MEDPKADELSSRWTRSQVSDGVAGFTKFPPVLGKLGRSLGGGVIREGREQSVRRPGYQDTRIPATILPIQERGNVYRERSGRRTES